METGPFLKFRQYTDRGAAIALVAMLADNDIRATIEEQAASFDPAFSRSEMNVEYVVQLKKEDFAKAETILKQLAAQDLQHVDTEHYLFLFSDEELRDVIAKEDEWSEYDVLLSQQILRQRGKAIPDQTLRTMKAARMKELARPASSPQALIFIGYIAALVGGFVAVMIGWYLSTHKKTLPNGDRFYSYAESDRRHGRRIFILGIIGLVCWALVIVFWGRGGDYGPPIYR
ncbi:MAG: hypothetical protein JST83_09660 [Bacteroidetes bacterium]|nr:hypothetical protein [Bacteroidota bacterium]